MTDAGPPAAGPAAPPSRSHHRRLVAGAIVVGLLAVGVLVVGVLVLRDLGRPVPSFPSLADQPDPSLHGTVAYFAPSTGCVRVVAASGGQARDALCLGGQDVAKAEQLGKETGPQLVWLPDDRLEITMFRMIDPRGPTYRSGWQKIVDVRTGAVEDVPEAEAPAEPNLDTHPTVDPAGRKILTSSDPGDGTIEIALQDASGTRVLLSTQGPGGYTYGLTTAFWSPDFRWIAADDGRILVITPDDPAVTRVLTDESLGGGFGSDDPRQAALAVTDTDLLGG